jgi:hypothetical protein
VLQRRCASGLAAEAPRILDALHPDDARACIGQIVVPTRRAGG